MKGKVEGKDGEEKLEDEVGGKGTMEDEGRRGQGRR